MKIQTKKLLNLANQKEESSSSFQSYSYSGLSLSHNPLALSHHPKTFFQILVIYILLFAEMSLEFSGDNCPIKCNFQHLLNSILAIMWD